jgi:hypothetical protein
MTKINIKYSIEDEVKKVMTTIKDINWFVKYGYSLEKLTLPKNLSIDNRRIFTEDKIRDLITKEYCIDDYEKNVEFLKNEWIKIEPELSKKIQRMGTCLENEYSIYFTKYGTGGSYDKPNLISINIKRRWSIGLLRTAIHELIHLSIEDLIQKYKINHWQKERIVDLIFLDFFPELNKMQTIPINTKEIDKNFYKYFPDINRILVEINKLKN